MQALGRGHASPRWGGCRQSRRARPEGKGTPFLYVEWRQRRPAKGGHVTAFPARPRTPVPQQQVRPGGVRGN